MKYIIDGKKFDTSKSELVIKFRQRAKELTRSFILGDGEYNPMCEASMYRTEKGTFIIIREYENNIEKEIISEAEAKDILETLNEVEKIEKLFGELEEI